MPFRSIVLCISLGLGLAASIGAQTADGNDLFPTNWRSSGPLHEVIVPASELGLRNLLESSPATIRRSDYVSFLHYRIDDRREAGALLLDQVQDYLRDEMHLIVANGFRLDTTRIETTFDVLPEDLRIGAEPGAPLPVDAGLYLIQFEGPIRSEWIERLESLDLRVVQYMPSNAYVLRVPERSVPALEDLRRSMPEISHLGVWQPAFRMRPEIRDAAQNVRGVALPTIFQLVNVEGVEAAVADITARSAQVLLIEEVGPYINLHVEIDPANDLELAHHPFVFAMEPMRSRRRLDERQGQIVAGNISGNLAGGPGYMAWLTSKGFNSSQFTTFSVNVVDDCFNLTGHPDLPNARIAFSQNPTNDSGTQGGHGFLNSHIIGGENTGTGSANEDTQGYNYGLGIAPFAHVGITSIFGPTNASSASWENTAYSNGARISSNSWGYVFAFDYDSQSQAYDNIVRDSRTGVGGNQEMMVVFAAGNDGSGSNTVSSPATAKNVLTVGASENERSGGTDGCGVGNSGANNVNDIINFSSRGPVNSGGGDGRWKPEIVAPGTHIVAGIPQSSYNGSSVCNQYFPTGQTLYGWSSGTSHSTPCVAGGAALVYQDFINAGRPVPSPAMQKAYLVNSATHMTGVGANDTLPSNSQGMGRMNLGRAFDGVGRIFVDQTTILGTTGATHVVNGSVSDTSKPFRVTLCWTDDAGPTTGAPWVNDLNLTVTIGGNTYLGNRFSGANSITGGSADTKNNTESVFLPAGVSGAFTVTVTGANIAGDGVPGNADGTDQDFALVIYNAATGAPGAPVAAFSGTPLSGGAPLLVNFTDSSTGTINTRSWDFGDGAMSTATNPSHSYANPGSYTVTLTVSGPGGSDAEVKTNYVTVAAPPPTADFSAAPLNPAPGQTVTFTPITTGTITTYIWTFGDGAFSTLMSPTHSYAAVGTYTVGLTVSGPGGNDTMTKVGYIVVSAPAPTADFSATPNPALINQSVAFTAITTGTISSYSWNFGDGGTSTLQNPSHTYTAVGSYTVSLMVSGPTGSDLETKTSFLVVNAPAGGEKIYVTFDATTVLPNIGAVGPEDVVVYDTATGLWAMYMDGSDIGLSGVNLDALHVFPNGHVCFSIAAPASLPNVILGPNGPLVTESDLLYFVPLSTGQNTSGLIYFVFDGSDVGLDDPSENIDGLYFAVDGSFLLISTTGAFNVPGAVGSGEDILFFLPQSYFAATAGSWLFAFDGSDVGFSGVAENIDAIDFDSLSRLTFSTTGAWSAGGAMGNGRDLVRYTGSYGANTAGVLNPQHDLGSYGVPAGANVVGLSVIPNP